MKFIRWGIYAAMLAFSVTLSRAWIAFASADEHAVAASDTFYTCPMHPNVHSKEPGECPICHMKLQKITTSQSEPTAKSDHKIKYYRNPMNPGVTSKTPTKDNMGMDYIPVYEDDSHASGSWLSNVEGRGLVSLDETQFKLSGTQIVKVARKDLESTVRVSGRALSPGRVSIQIPERDLGFVKPGLPVELESPVAPDRKILGHVTSFDSILDPMTRSLRADVQLATAVPALRSEASATGSIQLKRNQTLVVPDSAILYMSSGPYVFIAELAKSRLIPRKVKTGLRNAAEIEILEGLEEGDSISAGPNFLIDSESRINASHE